MAPASLKEIKLFEGKQNTAHVWDMCRRDRLECVGVLTTLLDDLIKGDGVAVTWHDIVKRQFKIDGQGIPEAYAEAYAEQVQMVRDTRHYLKEAIEERGKYALVIINEAGTSALRGGTPAGFALRESLAGVLDEKAQFSMTTGRMRASVARRRLAGHLDASHEQQAIGALAALESALHVPTDADPSQGAA